ncbi:MAG: MOSC domain-containing protein [Caldilineaceae bacterium]
MTDARGAWESSIYREQVHGPVMLETRGLVGDKATQPYHGTPELAVCCHFLDHYRFWNAHYDMNLQAGNVGENWALENIREDEVCIGDIYRVGAALVQVSAPRSPCETQARRIGRPDWVKLTLQELRTGIYLRVLEPGMVQAGDAWRLVERLNPGKTPPMLNRCWYHEFDAELAQEFAAMPGLMQWWQQRFAEKLERTK